MGTLAFTLPAVQRRRGHWAEAIAAYQRAEAIDRESGYALRGVANYLRVA